MARVHHDGTGNVVSVSVYWEQCSSGHRHPTLSIAVDNPGAVELVCTGEHDDEPPHVHFNVHAHDGPFGPPAIALGDDMVEAEGHELIEWLLQGTAHPATLIVSSAEGRIFTATVASPDAKMVLDEYLAVGVAEGAAGVIEA